MLENIINKIWQQTIGKIYNYINAKEVKDGDVVLPLRRSLQPDWWSCAIHSTFTILNYFNKLKNINDLKEYISYQGSDTPVIIKMLEKYDLKLEEIWDSELSDIKRAINKGSLIIITINDTIHWVVIYGYSVDSKDNITHLFIADPAIKRIKAKWSLENFESMWKEWDERWLGVVKSKTLSAHSQK